MYISAAAYSTSASRLLYSESQSVCSLFAHRRSFIDRRCVRKISLDQQVSVSCSALQGSLLSTPCSISHELSAGGAQPFGLPLRSQRTSACKSHEDDGRVADEIYMQEYADLKANLFDTSRKSGAAVAAYLFLAANSSTALCGLIGMGFSNIYLLWLYRDVDNVKPTDNVPMFAAKNIESPVMRTLAIWAASYYHALRPRLLVPIALAALMATYNSMAETPLTGFQEAGLLLGFLSYKVALLIKVAENISVKGYADESSRPRIEQVEEDEALQLDRWGRPMTPQFTMPTDALPEGMDPQNPGLLTSLLVKAAEGADLDQDERL